MINWDNVQKRYLDPYSSDQLIPDVPNFTESLVSIFETNKGIVKGLNPTISSNHTILLSKGVVCVSKVFIEFTVQIEVDIQDTFFYKTPRLSTIADEGWYPIVIQYKYERIIGVSNSASIKILKYPESEYNKNEMVIICNVKASDFCTVLDVQKANVANSKWNRQNLMFHNELLSNSLSNSNYSPIVDGGNI